MAPTIIRLFTTFIFMIHKGLSPSPGFSSRLKKYRFKGQLVSAGFSQCYPKPNMFKIELEICLLNLTCLQCLYLSEWHHQLSNLLFSSWPLFNFHWFPTFYLLTTSETHPLLSIFTPHSRPRSITSGLVTSTIFYCSSPSTPWLPANLVCIELKRAM